MNLYLRNSVLILLGLLLNGSKAFAEDPPPPAAGPPPSQDLPPPVAAPMAPPPAAPEMPPMAVAPAPAAPSTLIAPAAPPLKIESGGNTIRVGLLLQPQFQAANSATLDGYSSNIYLRRTRLLVGGTLFGVVDYFIDTDYPNLFLPINTAAAGMPDNFQKNQPGMNIQDAFGTYKIIGDHFKVDAGYMLPPLAHNAVQGATTLYAWDYFAYTFQSNEQFNSTGNPVGRDMGVQLRGLVLDGHLEYRGGLFQGRRDNQTATEVSGANFFRATARVQVNVLDPETGFFYQGTYLGAKKILSFGGSVDVQDSYKYFAGDGFLDLPAGPGVVTAQVNVAHWNGETFIPTLVKQTALMSEVGYNIAGLQLSPIFRYERLWSQAGAPAGQGSQTRYEIGLGLWPFGHNMNLKAFYSRIKNEGAPGGFNQFNVQWQIYVF